MKIDTILFDMDGVLIDSEELMAKSGILALRDFGIDAKAEDFIPFVGRGENNYLGGVARKYGKEFDPEMKRLCYEYYGIYAEEETNVPPEIPDLLYRLKQKGYRIAVCTSADMGKVVHNLRAMKTEQSLFDAFITGDRVTQFKPDPQIYLMGAQEAGSSPERCIVVEDSPSGVKAAHNGGMKAVGIVTSFSEEYLVGESHPDWVIHSLSELEDILDAQ